ncbi:TRAP transporter substrate-binding protein [Azospirillum thermophilum]|uniref:C4-dicarboxylate ABC transporter substrate-binding protein n=1 Tax=Azospirillum thermophilum TaxID=2202148 RepID=A0A2S2CUG0_9PROT|nr:TRAP transporter substrate-binding protein [Azospirillum thermophilum]AWK88141.1 C4-dicarboxylate ABC transporter substrate-binding protein [Azospirillum thermophilum]
MKTFAALVAAGLAFGFSTAALAEKWDMPTAYPDGNYHTENIRRFAQDVKAATNGGLEITIHSNASLFKHPEIKRAVQTGQVQAGEVLMSILANEDPMFEVDSVPFLATSFDQADKLAKVSRPFVEQRFQKTGLRVLFTVPWTPQGLYTKNPVAQSADLKGVKLRTYNASTSRFAELIGAVPATVQAAEVPQAFSAGLISAMITSPATGVDTQAWDFVKNYYDVQAFIPKNVVFVNERAFRKLPEDTQKAVLKAAADAETRGWETARKANDELLGKLRQGGMSIQKPSAAFQKELEAIGVQMSGEWATKAGEDGSKVLTGFKTQ